MFFKIVSVLVFEFLEFSSANETEYTISEHDLKYCDHKCGTVNHTLCNYNYPPHGPKIECAGVVGGLTAEEKDILLEIHNELRRQTAVGETPNQPVGANMLKLKWDDEIAQIAQRLADQCMNNEHDTCKNTLAGESVGQNLDALTATSRTLALKELVNKWFGQNTNFNPELVGKYARSDDSAGNYGQIVWAKTLRVGCGFSAQERDLDSQYMLVCNYVPSGLVDGEEVYVKGIPCTKCPKDSACSVSVPGLCTFDKSDQSLSKAPTFTRCDILTLMLLVLHFKLFVG